MRSAEILVELLLDGADAKVFGIVFGPGIPRDGYWVSASNLSGLFTKIATGLDTPSQGVEQAPEPVQNFNLDTFIKRGYTLVTDADDGISVYGLSLPVLSDSAIRLLKVKATTPVVFNKSSTYSQTTDGRNAFGVSMTPEEKAEVSRSRAAATAQPQVNPDEQEEFDQFKEKRRGRRAWKPWSPEEEEETQAWQRQQAQNVVKGGREAERRQPSVPQAPEPPPMPPSSKKWTPGQLKRWLRRHPGSQ